MTRRDDIYDGFIDGTGQLDPADSLTGQIGQDPLDAGYSPPDREPVATRYASTEEEVLRGETLEQRLAEEEPDVNDGLLDSYLEHPRAGRLVAPDEGVYPDVDQEAIALDVGRAGWASSAEEAAMHIVDESELDGSLN
jgi:hypothetical protein